MGIILIPVFLIGIGCLIACVYIVINRLVAGIQSPLWLLLSPIVSIFPYTLMIYSWSGKQSMWVLTPLFEAPFYIVILPFLMGAVSIMLFSKTKTINTICVVYFLSILLSAIVYLLFPALTDPTQFYTIEITH